MQRKGEKMVNANLSEYERKYDVNRQYTTRTRKRMGLSWHYSVKGEKPE